MSSNVNNLASGGKYDLIYNSVSTGESRITGFTNTLSDYDYIMINGKYRNTSNTSVYPMVAGFARSDEMLPLLLDGYSNMITVGLTLGVSGSFSSVVFRRETDTDSNVLVKVQNIPSGYSLSGTLKIYGIKY